MKQIVSQSESQKLRHYLFLSENIHLYYSQLLTKNCYIFSKHAVTLNICRRPDSGWVGHNSDTKSFELASTAATKFGLVPKSTQCQRQVFVSQNFFASQVTISMIFKVFFKILVSLRLIQVLKILDQATAKNKKSQYRTY